MSITLQEQAVIEEGIDEFLSYIPQTIATAAEANEVGKRLLAVKEVVKNRTEYFESMRQPAYAAYQAVLQQGKEAIKLPLATEAALKKILSEWARQKGDSYETEAEVGSGEGAGVCGMESSVGEGAVGGEGMESGEGKEDGGAGGEGEGGGDGEDGVEGMESGEDGRGGGVGCV